MIALGRARSSSAGSPFTPTLVLSVRALANRLPGAGGRSVCA